MMKAVYFFALALSYRIADGWQIRDWMLRPDAEDHSVPQAEMFLIKATNRLSHPRQQPLPAI